MVQLTRVHRELSPQAQPRLILTGTSPVCTGQCWGRGFRKHTLSPTPVLQSVVCPPPPHHCCPSFFGKDSNNSLFRTYSTTLGMFPLPQSTPSTEPTAAHSLLGLKHTLGPPQMALRIPWPQQPQTPPALAPWRARAAEPASQACTSP